MSTIKSRPIENCPWKENLRSPTQYRLDLARRFSKEGRKIFGPRWKGIYVIGSTASSFASPLRDVDVVPLIEKPEGKPNEAEFERFIALDKFIKILETQTGVFIEQWLTIFERNPVGKDADIDYLDRIQEVGAERVIAKSAILLDESPDLGLYEKLKRPLDLGYYRRKDTIDPTCGRFLINRYGKNGNFLELRGENPAALEARMEFNRAFMKELNRFLALVEKIIKKFEFGEFESFIVAFSLLENFIPLQYGIYERLEFLISNYPEAQVLVGSIPDKPYMLSTLFKFSKALSSEDYQHLEDKLRAFNSAMQEHFFIGGPIFLLDRK